MTTIILKKTCLLGLSLLFIFSIVGFIGVTNLANGENGVTINTNPTSDLHRPSLYSLFLSGDVSQSWMASLSNNFLSVLNGLIVGDKNNANNELNYVFIGGGIDNSVKSDYAGIGGGSGNSVSLNGHGDAIGGGKKNEVSGNYGVVVGGYSNEASNYGVVVGGQGLTGKNGGVVLGGERSVAGNESLVLGKNARGENYSFAWNKGGGDYEAGIQADNGVLIGTYDVKPGVALVVSGAIELSKKSNEPKYMGEMRNNNGCIEVYDGGSRHVLGKTSESKCSAGAGCIFGKTKMQNGDTLVGYTKSYAENSCNSFATDVTCNNGDLSIDAYPYCYVISPASNPINPSAPLVP